MSNQLYVVVGNRGFEPSDTDGVVPWLWDSSEGAKLKADHLNKFESTGEYYAAAVFIVRKEWVEAVQARADELDRLRAENERLREALEWYKAQVGGCNRYGSDGDKCRDALAKDIGERARAALQADGGRE